MAIKPRMIRKWRKEIMKNAENVNTKVLNQDDDGSIWPDKKDWGYAVNFKTKNGYTISAADDSWYGAWQGAVYCLRWAKDMPSIEQNDEAWDNILELQSMNKSD